MVDDSHAVGFVGAGGRGTPEHCGVMGRVDILTGTLGKALGGAQRRLHRRPRSEIIDWLRQRSRPVPVLQQLRAGRSPPRRCACSSCSKPDDELRARLARQRRAVPRRHGSGRLHARAGRASDHPGDARRREARRARWPTRLLDEGIYVIGFSFPVVPQGKARIRTQMSAAHTRRADSTAPSPRSPRSAASWA